jgi:hypothetical protein
MANGEIVKNQKTKIDEPGCGAVVGKVLIQTSEIGLRLCYVSVLCGGGARLDRICMFNTMDIAIV